MPYDLAMEQIEPLWASHQPCRPRQGRGARRGRVVHGRLGSLGTDAMLAELTGAESGAGLERARGRPRRSPRREDLGPSPRGIDRRMLERVPH